MVSAARRAPNRGEEHHWPGEVNALGTQLLHPSQGWVRGYQRGAGHPLWSRRFHPYTTVCSSCVPEQELVTKRLSEGDLSKTPVMSAVL